MDNIKLYKNVFKDDTWIRIIDSWKPWKTITVVCATHWDEIVWIQVINYLLNDFWLEKKILKWKINFVIWNKKWYLNDKKFIDTDLNRIWDFKNENKNTYEFKRAKRILPYLQESNYVLDLHSTTNPSKSIFIPNQNVNKGLLTQINANYIIKWILPFIHWKTLIDFDYKNTKSKTETMVIEWWQNNKTLTIEDSIRNTLNILNYYWFIDFVDVRNNYIAKTYEIKDCFYAKSMDVSFVYRDNIKSFQNIKKWDLIYTDNNKKVFAPFDFEIIMPTKPRYIWEEIWYIARNINN